MERHTISFPRSEFWAFSLAVYARPGIPAACLELQERHGADVNLVLAALWAAYSGLGRLDAADWERLEGVVGAFHREVVRPLRTARRALKPIGETTTAAAAPAGSIRLVVKAAELDAEHLEQIMIEADLNAGRAAGNAGAAGAADPDATARRNVLAYLTWLGRLSDSRDEAAIGALVNGGRSVADSRAD